MNQHVHETIADILNPMARTEAPPPYIVEPRPVMPSDDELIECAMTLLWARLQHREAMTSPQLVKQYLLMRAAEHDTQGREAFAVLFLDSQNRIIRCETMFMGTLTQASVYPREIVKRALELHAAGVILTHNHPSGVAEPSRADDVLTSTIKSALALVDVRVIDHIITAGPAAVSFAERGLV